MSQPPIKLIKLQDMANGVLRVILDLSPPDEVLEGQENHVIIEQNYWEGSEIQHRVRGCVTALSAKARTFREPSGEFSLLQKSHTRPFNAGKLQ